MHFSFFTRFESGLVRVCQCAIGLEPVRSFIAAYNRDLLNLLLANCAGSIKLDRFPTKTRFFVDYCGVSGLEVKFACLQQAGVLWLVFRAGAEYKGSSVLVPSNRRGTESDAGTPLLRLSCSPVGLIEPAVLKLPSFPRGSKERGSRSATSIPSASQDFTKCQKCT